MKTTNLQSPWRVIVSQHSNKKPSAWEIVTKYGGVIAETNSLTNDTIPRLISAAPDLLEALQAIVSDYSALMRSKGASADIGGPSSPFTAGAWVGGRLASHIVKAHGIISKARGEA